MPSAVAFLQLVSSPPRFSHHISNKGFILVRRHSGFKFGSQSRIPIPGFKLLRPTAPFASSSSSSSPIAGSAVEYPERWPDEKKQTRKRIAGIDQEELLDPPLLADPDSCFCEFEGVNIHHKVSDAESQTQTLLQNQTVSQIHDKAKKVGIPMISLHGFGASVFSWHQAMKPLAQVTGSKVLAFDRPAFGLTSREYCIGHSSSSKKERRPLNPYSMAFSILATLYFIDSLGAEKAILVGHSAGSLVAVNSYFEAPERIAALILVAPAILAPLFTSSAEGNQLERDNSTQQSNSSAKGNHLGRDDSTQQGNSKSTINQRSLKRIFQPFSKLCKYISQAILQLVRGMGNMLSNLYKRVVSAVLRSALGLVLVRMVIDKFGIAAVRNAWYDSSKVTDHVLHGYTKPLRTRGWDRALVEFTATMLTDSVDESKGPWAARLKQISCPVLLITGDSDRLVPQWNTKRLSHAITGSRLEVIKNCGHLPHEEKTEDFVQVVGNFLQGVFSDREEHSLEVAT